MRSGVCRSWRSTPETGHFGSRGSPCGALLHLVPTASAREGKHIAPCRKDSRPQQTASMPVMCDYFEPWLGIEGGEHGGRQAIVVHENGILADEGSAVTRDVEVEDPFDRADLDVGDLDAPGELPQHVAALQLPCHRPPLPHAPETVVRGRDDFFVSKAQAERRHGRIVVQANDRLVRET